MLFIRVFVGNAYICVKKYSFVFVKSARIEKARIRGELHYVLKKKASYSFALEEARKNGGRIYGKELRPTNAQVYLRILHLVGGETIEIELRIFIKERDFLEGKYRYWCRIVASARGFPEIEIPVFCENVRLSKSLFRQMKRMIGASSAGNK